MKKVYDIDVEIGKNLLECITNEDDRIEAKEHYDRTLGGESHRIVNLYKELEYPIITDLDKNALEIYCENFVIYRKAMEKVRETTEVYKSEYGPKVNPWLKVANDASTQMKKYSDILLLDPVSRARVGLAKTQAEKDDISPMAVFLKNRG